MPAGGAPIVRLDDADYRYRTVLPKAQVAQRIAAAIIDIQYDRFKPSVTDKRRMPAYLDVWSRMDELQYELSAGEMR